MHRIAFLRGSPLSSEADGYITAMGFSVDTPHSAMAGGAVRMRRITFLLKSE
jgi:hypothetical protein